MFDIGIAIASAIYHIDRCSLFYRASEIVAGESPSVGPEELSRKAFLVWRLQIGTSIICAP